MLTTSSSFSFQRLLFQAMSDDEPERAAVSWFGPGQPGLDDFSSEDSDAADSDASIDSATARAAAADARLKDYGADEAAEKPIGLPSAAEALDQVTSIPAFLDPEATRRLVTDSTHGSASAAAKAESAVSGRGHGPKGRIPAGQEFDIARLAPPGKGENRNSNKRVTPAAAVIEAKAKKNKVEEAGGLYSNAQVALMGGNLHDRSKESSAAMPVQKFMEKGVGGALLPRKGQDRRDKEKRKRELGQSSIGNWKTETEMVMRQQYD